jgi:hypothetical protein
LNSKQNKYLLILPVLFISLNVYAWSNTIPGGGRPAGMGNAFVSQYDLVATLYNQAGLANLTSPALMVFFENRYLMSELSSRGLLIGIPSKSGVFAFCIDAFGPAKWMETTFSINYSKRLNPKLSGGIRFNCFGMKLPEENQTLYSLGAELGFIIQLSPTLFAGVHLANPFSIPFRTSTHSEEIPYRFTIGGHALITNEITVTVEAEKTETQNIVFKIGVEWEPVNHFYLRGGCNSGPSKLNTGIGFKYRGFTADVAFGYHQVLGVTPSISVKYDFK